VNDPLESKKLVGPEAVASQRGEPQRGANGDQRDGQRLVTRQYFVRG